MSITSYHCLVIKHYDGSIVQAYKLFQGDTYRLNLREKQGMWSWKLGKEKDNQLYLSRESALLGCVGFMFRRIMQLQVAIAQRDMEQTVLVGPGISRESYLPDNVTVVDKIDIGNDTGYLEIVESEKGYFYAYGGDVFCGPYISKEQLFKDLTKKFMLETSNLIQVIDRVRSAIELSDIF